MDDTDAFQCAINTCAGDVQKPLFVPPGIYRISSPLIIPSYSALIGSDLGLGYGCRIVTQGCPALVIVGPTQVHHSQIENFMIWLDPESPAPDCIIAMDNSYSIALRNIHIHHSPAGLGNNRVAACASGGCVYQRQP